MFTAGGDSKANKTLFPWQYLIHSDIVYYFGCGCHCIPSCIRHCNPSHSSSSSPSELSSPLRVIMSFKLEIQDKVISFRTILFRRYEYPPVNKRLHHFCYSNEFFLEIRGQHLGVGEPNLTKLHRQYNKIHGAKQNDGQMGHRKRATFQ